MNIGSIRKTIRAMMGQLTRISRGQRLIRGEYPVGVGFRAENP
jgi:hypothetical protein